MENYIEINRETWNKKTEVHINSDFYANEEFLKGKSSLNCIELDLLGDIKGKKVLHLQCHFGQDSISLARMGANVTAIDLSDKAIAKAKEMSKQIGVDVNFICCNIYDLPQYLDEQFDLVYTSYGVIGWLPDMDKWAKIVSRYLRTGGKFIFIEFHPFIWMYDDDLRTIVYNYFKSDPIVETTEGTYADREASIETQTITWNHSISEVLNSLIRNNIVIKSFDEFDYSPYACFNNTIEYEKGKYRIRHLGNKIPLTYSLVGKKE